MNYLLENKRKSGSILGALLIFIPYLAMEFIINEQASFNFIDIIFPPESGVGSLAAGFALFLYVVYPILIVSVISVILNLVTERFVIISVIIGIIALGLHVLFYFWVNESLNGTMGIGWYIMGVGFILLIVSPFLKKLNVQSSDTNG